MNYKKDFPIFKKRPDLVYLDTGVSAQKPQVMIDAITNFYSFDYANIHRGLYDLSERATQMYDEGRKTVGNFINADFNEVIFVRNTTEAINLVVHSFAFDNVKKGDTVLVTEMEHHSNFVPWKDFCDRTGAILKVVRVNSEGYVSAQDVVDQIDDKVKLVCVTQLSNVLGVEVDVKIIVKKAHEVGAHVLVDAAQSIVHKKVDVKDLDCDFLVFSGHKLYGPTGIGVLYAKANLLKNMRPFLYGGDMIKSVKIDKIIYADLPEKFEAGTPNIEGVVGLKAAIDYVESIGMTEIEMHDRRLCDYAVDKLKNLDFVKIVGPDLDRISAVSFVVDGVHPHDVAQILSDDGICVRAGHHCAQPLNDALGYVATVRFSFGIYNDEGDIDKAIEALKKVKKIFA